MSTKTREMNLNDNVEVTLTDAGLKMWREDLLNGESEEKFTRVIKVSVDHYMRENNKGSEGRHQFQMWELMNIFGKAMYCGVSDLPFKNNKIVFLD